MHTDHLLKRLLFKSYAGISITGFIVALLLLLFKHLEWPEFTALAAGIYAFAFSVQKQNLEEIKLFKELFEQFNDRYDKMNNALNQISDLPLKEHEIKTLFKYFNVCGEEYLYFKKGFICPEVWHAWENGMRIFRQNLRIKTLWDKELKSNAYYGLQFRDES